MVLQSQHPRTTTAQRQKHAARKAPVWVWIAAGAVIAAVAGLYALTRTGEDPGERVRASGGPAPTTSASAEEAAAAAMAEARRREEAMARQTAAAGVGLAASPTAAQTGQAVRAVSVESAPVQTGPVSPTSSPASPSSPADGVAPSPAASATIAQPTPAAVQTAVPPSSPQSVADAIKQGMARIAEGKTVEGRRLLSGVLVNDAARLTAADAQAVRDTLASVNASLVFSDRVEPDDPFSESYEVKSGDLLGKIVVPFRVPYQLIEKINRTPATRIRVGQRLKMVRGPFHAVVDKSEFRMDVFLHTADGTPIYIRSFSVGLGDGDSTPPGAWVVKPTGKLANPSWTDPRTGKFYSGDDPANPIGEHWLGLDGIDDQTRGLRGYGIHGTIDAQSIGQMRSMGCVRMHAADIEMVYSMLWGGASTVLIRP